MVVGRRSLHHWLHPWPVHQRTRANAAMNLAYALWLRLRLWAVYREILQIEWRIQTLQGDLREWNASKDAIAIELFEQENKT